MMRYDKPDQGSRAQFRRLRECWPDWLFAAAVVLVALTAGAFLEFLALALFDLPPATYLR